MPAILQVRNIYLKIILLLKIEKKFEFVIYEMSSIKIIRKGITVEYFAKYKIVPLKYYKHISILIVPWDTKLILFLPGPWSFVKYNFTLLVITSYIS